MPTQKCYFCRKARAIVEPELACKMCESKELDVLIGVYWFIHCHGSEFCSLRTITVDMDPVGGVKPAMPMVKSWLRRGYLERNEINCVRVPVPVADHLAHHGYNQSAELAHVLDDVSEKHRKEVCQGSAPAFQEVVQASRTHRMVFRERGA